MWTPEEKDNVYQELRDIKHNTYKIMELLGSHKAEIAWLKKNLWYIWTTIIVGLSSGIIVRFIKL